MVGPAPSVPFAEFTLSALGNLQELHLQYHMLENPIYAVLYPSQPPSLQTLAIVGCTGLSQVLSVLLYH